MRRSRLSLARKSPVCQLADLLPHVRSRGAGSWGAICLVHARGEACAAVVFRLPAEYSRGTGAGGARCGARDAALTPHCHGLY